MKRIFTFLLLAVFAFRVNAEEVDSTEIFIQEIENSLKYDSGTVSLSSGNAKIHVPKDFKFLDAKQAQYVLTELWGNPEDASILGLLIPKSKRVMDADSWIFTVSYDEMGYVKDDDAKDMDYDQVLKDGQKEVSDGNKERTDAGYEPIEWIGWAAAPHYDSDKKVIYWAKELKFGEEPEHTLNYNLRILGRKGIFVVNAVSSMKNLPEVEANIDGILSSVEFNEGHKYTDFVPGVDNVAAWTVGGLVAGKVLAKAGIFAAILKFWKVIAVAFTAIGAAVWKRIKGNSEEA